MSGWKILCGGLVFVAVSTVAAAGLGVLAGQLGVLTTWLSLGAGLAAGAATAWHAAAPRQRITPADAILWGVFALVSLRAFLWVIYPAGNELRVLSPHNLGDMALHLNLIQYFANGGRLWPDNPFLANAIFPYHPGMDLWNALLRVAGVPLYEGLRWTGLLGAAAAAVALWRWGRGFAVAGFLFAGSLAAVAMFGDDRLGILEGVAWKNPFLTMLVTQRGLLYSLPAGLVLMTVWRSQLAGEGPRLPVLAQAALYASMPVFNAPAFLFLSTLLAGCAVAGWIRGGLRPFLTTGLVSVIPASWLVFLVTAGFTASSGVRYEPGWMMKEGDWGFWLENFGIFLPLAAVLGVMLFRRGGGNTHERAFYAVGAATLIFSFLFLLAPWAWDNTKLILWGYLALLPLLWSRLLARWNQWERGLACLLLFGAGALTLAAGLDGRHGYSLADRQELSDVQVMLRGMPARARIATAPTHEHPVLLLGQPVVMGYDGHLYSQGLDYIPVLRDLNTLMAGAPGWRDAARRLQVRYLFWGPRESARWPLSRQPWRDCAQPLGGTEHGQIYLLTPCLLGDE